MVVDGLGVARAQAIMDERRGVEGAPNPHRPRHSSMMEGGIVDWVSSSIPICILYLCSYLIVFAL